MIENIVFLHAHPHVDRVFQNNNLVQKMIEYVAYQHQTGMFSTKSYLSLRAVSKAFNAACLSEIRKKNRDLKISTGTFCHEWSMRISGCHKNISFKDVAESLRFFRNVANVRIESVHFLKEIDPRIHHDFMEILIATNQRPVQFITGDGEFCSSLNSECIHCRKNASKCKEFGPITVDVMQNGFEEPHHFERLRVTNKLLSKIARSCETDVYSTESCMSLLKSFLNPNISCDCLHIIISKRSIDSYPREVIEEMIKAWKVKWIHFQLTCFSDYVDDENASSFHYRFFSPIEFSSNSEDISVSDLKLEKVIVDVTSSDITFHETDPYLNIFSNIRRLFPSDTILFNGPSFGKHMVLEHLLVNILNNLWNNSPGVSSEVFFEIGEYTFSYDEMFSFNNITDDVWLLRGIDFDMVHDNTIQGFVCNPASVEVSSKFDELVSKDLRKDAERTQLCRSFTLQNGQKQMHFRISLSKFSFDDYYGHRMDTDFQEYIISHFS